MILEHWICGVLSSNVIYTVAYLRRFMLLTFMVIVPLKASEDQVYHRRDGSGLVPAIQREDITFSDFRTEPFSLAWNMDGNLLSSYSDFGNTISVMDVENHKVKVFTHHGDFFVGKALAFVGHHLLVTRPTNMTQADITASVIDVITGEVVVDIPGPNPGMGRVENWARTIVVAPDNSFIVIIAGSDSSPTVGIYLTSDWSRSHIITAGLLRENGQIIATSADVSMTRHLLVIGGGNSFTVYDIQHGYRFMERRAVSGTVQNDCCITSLSFGNDSNYLTISSSQFQRSHDVGIRVIELDTSAEYLPKGANYGNVIDESTRAADGLQAFISGKHLCLTRLFASSASRRPADGISVRFSPIGDRIAYTDRMSIKITDVPLSR